MAIYAKTLSPEWRKAFEEYEDLTGFEPMHQEAIDAGETTPQEAWHENIKWLEDLVADAINIETPTDFGTT